MNSSYKEDQKETEATMLRGEPLTINAAFSCELLAKWSPDMIEWDPEDSDGVLTVDDALHMLRLSSTFHDLAENGKVMDEYGDLEWGHAYELVRRAKVHMPPGMQP